jgi:hypothetical protein
VSEPRELRCGQCGQRVRVHSGSEGTNCYIGVDAEEADALTLAFAAERARGDNAEGELGRLRTLVAECYGARVNNGGYIPSALGDRLRDALGGS